MGGIPDIPPIPKPLSTKAFPKKMGGMRDSDEWFLMFVLADPLAGKFVELFLEEFREILGRVKAYCHRELGHLDVRALAHDAASLLQTDAVDEACDALSCQGSYFII